MGILEEIKSKIEWDDNWDESYKKSLISDYKIYKRKYGHKKYNFKSLEEEEKYFLEHIDEEIYYYTFVVKWKKLTDEEMKEFNEKYGFGIKK